MMIYLSKIQDIYQDVTELISNYRMLPQCIGRVEELCGEELREGIIFVSEINKLEGEKVSYKFKDNREV